MAQAKKQSFFGGAAVLAAGVVVVKIIGAIYKIPLNNILGPEGNTSFTNAYNIYTALLTVSTAGLPVALSKMVSEATALGRENQARRIFRVSAITFLTLGAISFCIMWFGNEACARRLNWPPAAYGIRTLAPAVVCVGALSAFRGYAQGTGRMTPTAVSQIIEAFCKLAVGLTLAQYLLSIGKDLPIAAAGAIAGVTVGTILAVSYMAVDYLRHRPRGRAEDFPDSVGTILRRLVSIAVPITLSTSMVSIFTLIDTSLVQGQLQNALHYTEKETGVLYGTYGAGMNIYNLPSSMMTALTISVLPTVSAALARRDREHTARVIDSSLRVTGLLVFPMGLGIWALSEPIFRLLYYPKFDSVLGGELLGVLGLASIFVCLMLIANSILQAHGRVHAPIVSMFIGGVIKVVMNYNLVAVPSINIHAAPVGTLVCFAAAAIMNLFFVYRVVEKKPNYLALFTKPLLASLLMAAAARSSCALLSAYLPVKGGLGRLLPVAGSVALAVVVYGVLVLALRIITRDDLALLPKGQKLAKLLRVK